MSQSNAMVGKARTSSSCCIAESGQFFMHTLSRKGIKASFCARDASGEVPDISRVVASSRAVTP